MAVYTEGSGSKNAHVTQSNREVGQSKGLALYYMIGCQVFSYHTHIIMIDHSSHPSTLKPHEIVLALNFLFASWHCLITTPTATTTFD
jgi:hypothetical protein